MSQKGFLSFLLIYLLAAAISHAHADDGIVGLSQMIQSQLAQRFPGARVELVGEPHWGVAGAPMGETRSVWVGDETPLGQASFQVATRDGTTASGWVEFAAYVPARILTRRVFPGERLSMDQFKMSDVNVAAGNLRELRGVILPVSTDVTTLQSRQTLVEGQPLLGSAVEKIPDVKRGDPVRVVLVSSGLTLSTRATASEPGYLNGVLHVMTDRTKREFTGTLVSPGVVEVKL